MPPDPTATRPPTAPSPLADLARLLLALADRRRAATDKAPSLSIVDSEEASAPSGKSVTDR